VSVAASLLAGCSGGSSSVLTPAGPAATTPQSIVNVALDTSLLRSAQNSSRRGAQFVGASVNDIHYAFTGGSAPFGDVTINPAAPCPGPAGPNVTCSGNAGTGVTYTASIAAPPGTYGLTLTLKNGSTALGSGSYINALSAPVNTFTISSGTTLPIAISIVPILAGPALAIENGQATDFFMEGHTQSIAMSANELDPVGNIISTYYGPVTDWQTLTLSLTPLSGTNGVSFIGGSSTILAPPSAPTGSTVVVQYNGTSANTSNLVVGLTDGTNAPVSVSIPYVSMSTTAPGNALTFSSGSINTTVTETATSGSIPDTSFVGSTTCSPSNVTVTSGGQPLGLNGIVAGVGSYTVQYVAGTGSCSFTVSSFADSNLKEVITVNY
jgi:hypothetical protein